MEFAGCSNDGSFGPSVHGCRGDFDFTIKFEKIFFSLLPSSVFIAIAAPRLVTLIRRPVVAGGAWYKFVKLFTLVVLTILQIALVGLAAHAKRLTSLFVASAVLDVLATLSAAAVSFFEHSHSPRPSILLGLYLPLLVLFDAAQTRSMWLMARNPHDLTFIKLFTSCMALRAVILLLESKSKSRWLIWNKKEHSPQEKSSIYSLLTYTWVRSVLLMGYKKVLAPSDLLPLDANLTVESLVQYTDKIQPQQFGHKKHALARSIAHVFAVPLLMPVAPRVANLALQLCQPLLIQSLLKYLDTPVDMPGGSANIGYGLIGAVVLIFLGWPLCQGLDTYYHNRFMVAIRATLVAKIYKHTTQAPSNANDDSAALTLMSTDVERVRSALMFVHIFWSTPLQVGISFWLLYRQLGASFSAPFVVILVCILASVVTTNIIGRLQTAWMARVQVRVGKTSNVIGNMKNIKLSGLAEPIKDAIQEMRVKEIAAGNKYRAVDVIISAFGFAPGQLAAMFTFIFTSRVLDASIIFSSVAYIALLSNPVNMLVQRAPVFISGLACLQRVQDFLEKPSQKDFRTFQDKSTDDNSELDSTVTAAKISHASIGWQEDKFIINDMSATIVTGFNMVIGPVASGKSTLCKALLGETPTFKGQILYSINARKSGFCDQVPVLLNANIQQNIIGFLPFNKERYMEVIDAAMLSPDLAILPYGDQTNIGSNGIALSGGQKQRVSLARALYQDFELYVFDDILSGLDIDTEQKVFERVFGRSGLLKKRGVTFVLCTHSVRHLPGADHILALSANGDLVEEGNFSDLMAAKKYVYSLGVQEKSLSSGSRDSRDDEVSSANEEEADGSANMQTPGKPKPSATEEAKDPTRSLGDSRTFFHYGKSIGVFWLLLFFLSSVGIAFFWNFPNVWLKFWAADIGPDAKHPKAYYVGIYCLFCVLSLLFLTLQIGIGLLIVTKMSGTFLHRSALNTLCAAPLGFFTRTDAGVLINLFSQDMTLIDDELPNSFVNAICSLAIGVGGAAVAAISSPYVLIAYPFIILAIYFLQRFYLRTSRQMRLLGLETKSPLYTNFIDTINGVVTFRAFGWTEQAIEKNNGFLDASQRPAYLQLMIQNWLTTLLNLMIGAVACLIVALATQLRTNPGFVGAGLVSIILCGRFFATYVLEYTMLENSLGAVSRLKAFDDKTTSEHLPGEDVKPHLAWPEKGRLQVHNLSASYADDQATYEATSGETEAGGGEKQATEQNLALHNLNMVIEPGQKIAICGRTGSGKSSLVLVLLRLLNPLRNSSFTLTIDGQPLEKVDRTTLRERIIAVPQEPVFLPDGSSFLANLDPSHQATEEECQASLEAVNLWAYIQDKGGLKGELNAEEFSQGQKQLFSLGRAILRRRMRLRLLSSDVGVSYLTEPKSSTAVAVPGDNGSSGSGGGGLLVLDEYSSSLDVNTDRDMQAIIHREFKGYTIVMVSHRLEMVMSFDKVVVLDAGAVVEEGVPTELAEQEGSRFRDLLLTGKTG